jgi:alpha-mannosidase
VRSDHATFEIQYGHVRRPAHFNTSFDTAKFEVCAQRWCDLGGHGHGLSVLNNCKYGHSVHGDTISVSLLRSSKEPNETMDVGKHYFTLALFPHAGRFQDAGTIREAAALNCPLRLVEPEGAARASAARASAAGAKSSWSFLSVSTAAVAVSAVKPAYAGPTPARFAESPAEESGTGKKRARRSGAPGSGDGPRRVIVRIHEQFGSHTGQAVRLAGLLAARATTVRATNILEDDLSPESELTRDDIRIKDGEIVLERGLAAFEIVTLMLDLA